MKKFPLLVFSLIIVMHLNTAEAEEGTKCEMLAISNYCLCEPFSPGNMDTFLRGGLYSGNYSFKDSLSEGIITVSYPDLPQDKDEARTELIARTRGGSNQGILVRVDRDFGRVNFPIFNDARTILVTLFGDFQDHSNFPATEDEKRVLFLRMGEGFYRLEWKTAKGKVELDWSTDQKLEVTFDCLAHHLVTKTKEKKEAAGG